MIVYLARYIAEFVMNCVNGESGSSLFIESTDSMILVNIVLAIYIYYSGKNCISYLYIL